MKEALAFVLPLFAMVFIVTHCTGCKPAVAVENSAALAQYAALLEECRAKGRAVGSYAAYQACADDVDAHLCSEHGLRCPGDK